MTHQASKLPRHILLLTGEPKGSLSKPSSVIVRMIALRRGECWRQKLFKARSTKLIVCLSHLSSFSIHSLALAATQEGLIVLK